MFDPEPNKPKSDTGEDVSGRNSDRGNPQDEGAGLEQDQYAIDSGDTIPANIAPPKATRPLPPAARVALEVVADLKVRRFRRSELEMEVFARGVAGPDAKRAVDALVRRGWAVADPLTVIITQPGWLAATTGEGVHKPKARKLKPPAKHRRLPGGLF